MTNHARLVFGLLLAIGLCLGAALLFTDGTFNHGQIHTDHQDMNQGGDGDRHASGHILWLGEAWGGLQIILFVTLLSLGMRRRRNHILPFALVGLAYLGIFFFMCRAYRHSIAPAMAPDPALFLGLPVPAAWMIYGLGGIPLVFAILYCVNFDRWVLDPEDHRTFLDAVDSHRRHVPAASQDTIDQVEAD